MEKTPRPRIISLKNKINKNKLHTHTYIRTEGTRRERFSISRITYVWCNDGGAIHQFRQETVIRGVYLYTHTHSAQNVIQVCVTFTIPFLLLAPSIPVIRLGSVINYDLIDSLFFYGNRRHHQSVCMCKTNIAFFPPSSSFSFFFFLTDRSGP